MNPKHKQFLSALRSAFPDVDSISRPQLLEYCAGLGVPAPQWYTGGVEYRAGRGLYKIPSGSVAAPVAAPVVAPQAPVAEVAMVAQVVPLAPAKRMQIASVESSMDIESCVPVKYGNYVEFGCFPSVKQVVKSGQFFPVFITGPSGNGKSMAVEQVCAQLGREFVAVSMTDESDEGDLLGNYVLIEGNMVWRDGPVTIAARKGAVLLIDEIDYGSKNLSCLQRVLEGKPFLLKKKNEVVVPAKGFNVIATANTKGQGSESGKFMYTNVLNEAFLERFPVTMEQPWAPKNVESKIVSGELKALGVSDDAFVEDLVNWANIIRKTYEDGGIDDVISTRRLVHIARSYSIFGDKMVAIESCLARFDADTKASFLDLFVKIRAEEQPAPAAETNPDESPF